MVEISLLKILLNEGLITENEYRKAENILIRKKKVAWCMDMLYIVYHNNLNWSH